MAKQSYALEPDGPKRLEITWSGIYRKVTVQLDGRTLGTIPDQKALASGQEFRLPDGSRLHVQLVSSLLSTELRILRNGQPLPGSPSDPHARLRNAYLLIYVIGGFNLAVGAVAELLNVEFLKQAGIGLASLVFGLMFLGLGYFVQRRYVFALIVAIVLFIVDGLAALLLAASSGGSTPVAGTFVRIILLVPMFQGIGAIKALKSQPAAPSSTPSGTA